MKKRILIIEDNYYKYFATKQVLEAQLKIKIQVVAANDPEELRTLTEEISPSSIMFRPSGGIVDLLTQMKRRRVNRRSTEVIMLISSELDFRVAKDLEKFCDSYMGLAKAA